MRGMGALLTMYGGAATELENDYAAKKEAYMKAQEEYKNAQSAKAKEDFRQMMIRTKDSMDQAKAKVYALLQGVKDAASKAAGHLSDGLKSVGSKLSSGALAVGSKLSAFGSKLSSGLKSFGSKLSSGVQSIGSKLSSGIKSVGSNISQKINDYQDKIDRKQFERLQTKYGTPSVASSTSESSQ
jgi:hypothetical protein